VQSGTHGDFERRMMPADSKCLHSALAISSFSGSKRRAFVKTGGWLPCEFGAPLHGKECATHHPCAGWRGIFEANLLRQQAQNQEWVILGLAQLLAKQKGVGLTWTDYPYS
jgi:hypothetical protein